MARISVYTARFPNPGVPPTAMAGLQRPPLRNSKGISVLFLIVALLLMMAVGYVLSYLIPTKQKSVSISHLLHPGLLPCPIRDGVWGPLLLQSGLERCNGSGRLDYDRLNDVGAENLVIGKVNGKFTINYNTGTNALTSTGEINNVHGKEDCHRFQL